MFENLLFCTQCDLPVDDIENMHFIDDKSNKGFCSAECITQHYNSISHRLKLEELTIRSELGIEVEPWKVISDDLDNLVLYHPLEKRKYINHIGDRYFIHIALNDGVYLIYICSHFNDDVSYIFHKVRTRSQKMLSRYRIGENINRSSQLEQEEEKISDHFEVEPEILEELELRKSTALADLLSMRSDDDISFEEFIDYESYLSSTLEGPDEIFDDSEDELSTYIKSFKRDDFSFFYVVVCWKSPQVKDNHQLLLPIIAFPSIDQDLYKHYAVGERTNKIVKN